MCSHFCTKDYMQSLPFMSMAIAALASSLTSVQLQGEGTIQVLGSERGTALSIFL